MKPAIYFVMAVILMHSAFALFAGNREVVMNFPECSELMVEVEGELEIEQGEYYFENCTEIQENKWFCSCSDNYNLTVVLDPRTVNNYNISAVCYYEQDYFFRSGGFSGKIDNSEEDETRGKTEDSTYDTDVQNQEHNVQNLTNRQTVKEFNNSKNQIQNNSKITGYSVLDNTSSSMLGLFLILVFIVLILLYKTTKKFVNK